MSWRWRTGTICAESDPRAATPVFTKPITNTALFPHTGLEHRIDWRLWAAAFRRDERVARLTSLAAGLFLASMAAMTARAASDETADPAMIASRAPTPLQEPHAVDKSASAAAQKPMPAKSSARHGLGVPKPKARPTPVETATAAKPAPARPKIAANAKPSTTPTRSLAHRLKRHPRAFAQAPRGNHDTAQISREARRDFQERREVRPESGPVYPAPPAAPGCDEACQYRDWLNRYAAWYRDFGRYYYGAPPHPAAGPRPMPPPPAVYGENRPPLGPPLQAYGRAQSERDRLDPWHGYNSHSPDNGY